MMGSFLTFLGSNFIGQSGFSPELVWGGQFKIIPSNSKLGNASHSEFGGV